MISFIVPVYNNEKYINECVNSILPVLFDKEIILINDGSLDSSGTICLRIASDNPNIRYFEKVNGGASSARNAGIDIAKGEYIVFVDCDDTLDIKWDDTIRKSLTRETGLYIYGMAFDYHNEKGVYKTDVLSNKFTGISSVRDIEDNFSDYFNNNALSSACNKLFRTDIIKNNHIRFNESMTLYEDFDFVIRYLCYVNNVIYIPEALYHYRILEKTDSTHTKNRTGNLIRVSDNLDCLSESVRVFSSKKNVHAVISNLYIEILISSLMSNNETMKNISVLNTFVNNDNIVEEELLENDRKVYEIIKRKEYWKLRMLIQLKRKRNQLGRALRKIIKR